MQSSSSSASWSHAIDVELSPELLTPSVSLSDDGNGSSSTARVRVQIFNETNFFFDMFPASASSSNSSDDSSDHDDNDSHSLHRTALDAAPTTETDSDDESDERETASPRKSTAWATARVQDAQCSPPAAATPSIALLESLDEPLGVLELDVAQLCEGSQTATDVWYCLDDTRAGEVRVRTLVTDAPGLNDPNSNATDAVKRDAIFRERVYSVSMRDAYGFKIPDHAQDEWAHLQSYEVCRERRRVSDWERAFGSDRTALDRAAASAHDRATVQQLARGGIPRTWRERVYMSVSGAREKQQNAGIDYYRALAEQTEQSDSATFRQIELDIDRTFGHSGTKICTEAGRAELRRILRAYSLRNPSVGYCQVRSRRSVSDKREPTVHS